MKRVIILLLLCNLLICSFGQNVKVIYGYLYVYPNEIGKFSSYPSNVISSINSQKKEGINTWRLPTMEELELLVAQRIITSTDGYMTKSNSSGRVLLVTTKDEQTQQLKSQGWVDLGLPSKTLWKDKNEKDHGLYKYDDVISKYGRSNLPTKSQFEELKNRCDWVWDGNGYKVIGPNGQSIYLPAEGYLTTNRYEAGGIGSYWSGTLSNRQNIMSFPCGLYFDKTAVEVKDMYASDRLSVRLVKKQ